jgi:hypothetical protein
MKYALIISGVVKQVQPNKQDGFIEVENNIICGMLYDGTSFSNPVIVPTPPTKEEQLNNLIVTITSGKRFYADPQSRTDLDGAVLHGYINNALDTLQENWKTADGWQLVTFAEMKEASRMALEAKGQIVGEV